MTENTISWHMVASALIRGDAGRPCRCRLQWLFVLLMALWCGVSLSAEQDDAPQVIVNDSVETMSLTRYKLRTVFGMRMTSWPNGDAVTVFVLPDDSPLHRRFAKQRLGVFPHQLRRAWNNLVYSGLAQAPNEVATEREMQQRVASTPGAIGYRTTGGEDAGIHVLSIQ